jgi:ABC-type lipoprotein release transport system permease subunit
MIQIFTMAFRDLGRHRRRSIFSALALAMGLAMLLLLASFIEGEYGNSIKLTIQLESGHLQVRAKSYDEVKTSLKYEDLVADPQQAAAQIASLEPVKLATPRLFASGIVTVRDISTGARIIGIDPPSEANAPYRDGLVEGAFLQADDREGILIGLPLARNLGVKPGDSLLLSANTSNGEVAEQAFTVRGVFSTNTQGYDSATVFLPLAKAQALTQAANHASTIFVVLDDINQTDAVAAALQSATYKVLTWRDMNKLLLETEDFAAGYMVILYLIILGITASVIMNTLIMAVFERTREIGILSSLGMKSSRVMAMFLAESTLLAIGGILAGLALGGMVVWYFSTFGFYIANMGITGILISNTIYAKLTLEDTVTLSLVALVVTMLAGLYPAFMAARMEPIVALRGGK